MKKYVRALSSLEIRDSSSPWPTSAWAPEDFGAFSCTIRDDSPVRRLVWGTFRESGDCGHVAWQKTLLRQPR